MRAAISIFLAAAMMTAGSTTSRAADTPHDKKGAHVRNFRGWDESIILETSGVIAVVSPAVGGRIVHYGVDGENIFFEERSAYGKTLATAPNGFSAGGYQCDLGPELRGIPAHEALWLGLYRWRIPKDHAASVSSEADMNVGVKIEKDFLIEPGSGDLGITQTLRNVTDKEVAYCLWDRTLCKNGGFAFFPLNKQSRFKAGWSQRRTKGGKFFYDGTNPSAPNVKVLKGVLVARCEGEEAKIGADSDAGWIAYVNGRMLFVKYFPHSPEGDYSDGGNSVEVYFDDKIAELEPLSPEIKLRPGESYSFPEHWSLIELKEEALTFEQARALVKAIPPSPFKRK